MILIAKCYLRCLAVLYSERHERHNEICLVLLDLRL